MFFRRAKNINLKSFLPYLDTRSIVVFRALLGVVILLDLFVNKWPNILYFYTESGIYLSEHLDLAIQYNPYRAIQKIGLLSFITSVAHVKGIFLLAGAATISYAVGFKPKWSGVIVFILLFSIQQRNPYVLSGPDELLISLLAWSLFLPIGNENFTNSNDKVVSIASVGLITQIALIYFYNADLKNGFVWQNGEGLSYALMEDLWTKSSADFLVQFPTLCRWLSQGTVVLEYAIPLLILIPYKRELMRFLAVIGLIVLHGTIFSFLSLGLFPLIAAAIIIVIMPTSFWDRVLKKRVKKEIQNESKYISHRITNVISACFLVLVFWKAILSHNHGENNVYHPTFMKYLNETALFRQYWAMYAPNPTLEPAWYKTTVLTVQSEFLDVKTELPHKDDLTYISEYKNYTWSLFFYWAYVYPDYLSSTMIQRWANIEKAEWDEAHPQNRAFNIYIFAYKKKITSAVSTTTPTKQTIAISKQ